MNKRNLIVRAFGHSLLVVVYVLAVSLLLFKAGDLFGKEPAFWAPFAMLLLFVLSAAIVGSLIFAKPLMIYLDGEKKAALSLLSYILGWIFVFTAILLAINMLI